MKTFDLDALEVEQNSTPFEFTWAGEQFTIGAGGIDIRVTGLLHDGDWAGAVKMLMGDDEWQRLLGVKAGKPFQLEHAIALVNAYAEHLGTTVGKSSASSTSSKSTATRSKRTSNGSSRRGSPAS